MARILFIDDDPDIRTVARITLRRGNHEVVLADGGLSALQMLASDPACDLIICDRMMPEMNGLETLSELRRRPAHSATPFVFLTAKAQQGEIEEGLRMGACAYLTKPFEPKELVEQVNRILESFAAGKVRS